MEVGKILVDERYSATENALIALLQVVGESTVLNDIQTNAAIAICTLKIQPETIRRQYAKILNFINTYGDRFRLITKYRIMIVQYRQYIMTELHLDDQVRDSPVLRYWTDIVNNSTLNRLVFSPLETDIVLKTLLAYNIATTEELLLVSLSDWYECDSIKGNAKCKAITQELYRLAKQKELGKQVSTGRLTVTTEVLNKWPSLFEIGEAWAPAKTDRYNCRQEIIKILRMCFEEKNTRGRFNLTDVLNDPKKTVNACDKYRFGGDQIIVDVQRAQMKKYSASLGTYASSLRAFGKFCKANNEQHFPPKEDVVALYVAQMKSASYANTFLAALTNACEFVGCSNKQWYTEKVKNMTVGLRKYREEKVTTFFSVQQVLQITESSAEAVERFVSDGKTDKQRLAMEFALAVLISFVFQVRFASEAYKMQTSTTDNEDSELNGRLRVLTKPPDGPPRVVLKLARRKNRQQYKRQGYLIVRHCCCNPGVQIFQTEMVREYNPFSKTAREVPKVYPAFKNPRLCPVHRIFAVARILESKLNAMERYEESPVFNIMTPKWMTAMLKDIVANAGGTLGPVQGARIHCFRKSGTNENAMAGLGGVHLMESGDWRSRAVQTYLDVPRISAEKLKAILADSDNSDDEGCTSEQDTQFLRSQVRASSKRKTK